MIVGSRHTNEAVRVGKKFCVKTLSLDVLMSLIYFEETGVWGVSDQKHWIAFNRLYTTKVGRLNPWLYIHVQEAN